jgi:hypothetical protein
MFIIAEQEADGKISRGICLPFLILKPKIKQKPRNCFLSLLLFTPTQFSQHISEFDY